VINLQLAEKPTYGRVDAGHMLDIHSIFHTIQGEGPFAGVPAVFVRTAGCILQCPSCDTEYTQGRRLMSVQQIADEVDTCRKNSYTGLVVLTGGEPLRQRVGPLIQKLIDNDMSVQIETNGATFDPSLNDLKVSVGDLTIVCSPKTGSVSEKLEPWIDHYKYIISAGKVDEVDGLPTDSLNFGVRPARPPLDFDGKIYCQPCDDQDEALNRANVQATIKTCMENGFIFCYQIHKAVQLP